MKNKKTVWLSTDLHKKIKMLSFKKGTSMESEIEEAIKKHLECKG